MNEHDAGSSSKPLDPKKAFIELRKAHETIHKLRGRALGNMVELEALVDEALGEFLELAADQAELFAEQILSRVDVGPKIEALEKMAARFPEFHQRFRWVHSGLKAANRHRNELAHASLKKPIHNGDLEAFRRAPFVLRASNRGNPRELDLTERQLEDRCKEQEELYAEMIGQYMPAIPELRAGTTRYRTVHPGGWVEEDVIRAP